MFRVKYLFKNWSNDPILKNLPAEGVIEVDVAQRYQAIATAVRLIANRMHKLGFPHTSCRHGPGLILVWSDEDRTTHLATFDGFKIAN